MQLWIACILFLIAVVCAVLLGLKMRTEEQKRPYIIGVTLLSAASLALLVYIVLTFCLVGAIA